METGFESGSDINLSDSAKTEKKPCEVCGSAANEHLIMTCFKCRDTREHTYCARVMLRRVPRIWLCEECRGYSSIAAKSANPQLSRTILVEQVVVNKVSVDQTVPLSRSKQLVDNEDPIDQTAPSSRTIQVKNNGISIEASLLSRTNQVLDNEDWTEAAPSSRTNKVVEQVVPIVPHILQSTIEEPTPESSCPVSPCSLGDETNLFHFNSSSVSLPRLMKKN